MIMMIRGDFSESTIDLRKVDGVLCQGASTSGEVLLVKRRDPEFIYALEDRGRQVRLTIVPKGSERDFSMPSSETDLSRLK